MRLAASYVGSFRLSINMPRIQELPEPCERRIAERRDWISSWFAIMNGEQREMNELGKFLGIVGLGLAALGALLWLGWGRGWLGRLPGDMHYTRGNFSFSFPIVTCLLLSLLLTLLLWIFRR